MWNNGAVSDNNTEEAFLMRKGSIVGATMVLLGLSGVVALAQGGAKLYLNGKLVSSKVRVIDGVPYVPLNDVAASQGMQVSKRSDGYNLLPQGGANQVAGKFEGAIGKPVFTGEYSLLVKSVEETQKYEGKYKNLYGRGEAGPNEALIIVNCQVKNGMKTKQNLVFDNWEYQGRVSTNTALADTEGRSYEPYLWDVKATEIGPTGVTLLPGAAADFALVFKVSKGAKPKDLVYSFLRYSDRMDKKPTDVRVSLKRE
jgi:hypothetical protein